MNSLHIATGGKWIKNKTTCILSFILNSVCILEFFFVLNWVRFSNPQRLTYTQILSELTPPPLPLPAFLETRWLVVNEQEDDSVIFQTNSFTSHSMVVRKWDN